MSKAEELAEKAYPVGHTKLSDAAPSMCRNAFIEGYRRAEKDNKLTWKDIVEIDKLLIDLGMMFPIKSTPDYYDEVLKRFKEMKEKRHQTTLNQYKLLNL